MALMTKRDPTATGRCSPLPPRSSAPAAPGPAACLGANSKPNSVSDRPRPSGQDWPSRHALCQGWMGGGFAPSLTGCRNDNQTDLRLSIEPTPLLCPQPHTPREAVIRYEQRARRQDQRAAGDTPSVDSALFWRADVRRVLAALDIGGLYRMLGDVAGFSQRQIAACAGQSQSEVSEIVVDRRRVESHEVLGRIAEGFDIPRELMGLSWWGPDGTYCGEVTVAEPPRREGKDVRRRTLLASTSMAAFGQVVGAG
jgi:transcriptional regulator with XRE-family HTH domain